MIKRILKTKMTIYFEIRTKLSLFDTTDFEKAFNRINFQLLINTFTDLLSSNPLLSWFNS